VGIALDVAGGKMYWIDDASPRDIRQANLDGTEQHTVLSVLGQPYGIALDVAEGKIYWTDVGGGFTGYIGRVNFDGSQQETLLSSLHGPLSIALQIGATPIAEPSTLLLLSIGAAGIIAWAWHKCTRSVRQSEVTT
jgi:hypothetical protein